MMYAFGKMMTMWYVRLMFRIRYSGLENIPSTGFILVSNHRTNYDPLLIAHPVPQKIHYMAKVELFRNKLAAWILRNVGAFPVSRGSGDQSSLYTAKNILHSGEVLGMFPEGTRSKTGKLLRPRSGVALIAGQTGADILPCAISFGEKLSFRAPIHVRYGKLLTAEELAIDPEKPSSMREASKRIMAEIAALLPEEEHGT